MPVLGPPVGSTTISVTGSPSIGTPLPTPPPGTKIPPLADSAVAYEYSYSTGTGPYTLAGAIGSWKPFADVYDDGATVTYRATDASARTEYVIGKFDASAGTLSRVIILGSTNANLPINWSGRTRVQIHALVQGLPLCDTPPLDKQILQFDAIAGEWCPATLTIPPIPPDDDTADMQDVTSGTTFNVTLTKPVTQVVWLSGAAGSKITNIPQCETSINGYSLDVKTTLGNGDDHFIAPQAGTIAGLSNLTFTDTNCNAFLRCDAQRNDWVLRCLCCHTPTAGTPPPPPGGSCSPMTIDGISDVNTYIDPTIPSRSATVTTAKTNDVLILNITIEQESPAGQSQSPATISGVSTPGLVWARLVSAAGQGPGFGGGNTFITREVWWAIATSAGTYTATVNASGNTSWFGMSLFGVNGADIATPWDTNASLPVISPTSAMMDTHSIAQVTGVATTDPNAMVLCFYSDFGGADPITLKAPAGFSGGASDISAGSVQAFIGLGYDSSVFYKQYCATPLSNETFTGTSGVTYAVVPPNGWNMIVHALRHA